MDTLSNNFQPANGWGEYAKVSFAINQAIAKIQTAIPVKVIACSNSGGVSPVGTVDVQPMVDQVLRDGTSIPHTTIFELPYGRVQGGNNAIIIDPEVGDIGLACFCSRDISSVIASKKSGAPQTRRKYDFADGVFVMGILNGAPTQYIQFTGNGIAVYSPQKVDIIGASQVNVTAPAVAVNASGYAAVTAPSVSLGAGGQTLHALIDERIKAWATGHTHKVISVGAQTDPPLQALPDCTTTTAKAG